TPKKKAWITKVRALRKALVKLKGEEKLDTKASRSIYLRVKGNWFRDKKHLTQFVKEREK
ncbi:MAG: 50S ribosomal protein L19e, partial [Candidatus Diapherotrites archaeon]|nr:50S ribosomal protein L19e [Candidatus Diapherotrites archaeon]